MLDLALNLLGGLLAGLLANAISGRCGKGGNTTEEKNPPKEGEK